MWVEFGGDGIWAAQWSGRPDGLVGFLRVLHFGGELARRLRQEVLAVKALHFGPSGSQCFVAEDHVVGTHVGDVPALVKTLSDAHHLGSTEAQLATALLLQSASHERSLRRAAIGLLLHRTNAEVAVRQRVRQRSCALLGHDNHIRLRHTVGGEVLSGGHFRAIDRHEGRGEGRRRRCQQFDVPITGTDEGDALALALDDQSNRR